MLDSGDGPSADGEWCSVAINIVVLSSHLSGIVGTPDEGKDVPVIPVVSAIISLTGETTVSVGDRVVRDVIVVLAITTLDSIRVVIE